jgi:competence protein ComFC
MWKTFSDLIFPIKCVGCNQEGQFLCFECFQRINLSKRMPLKDTVNCQSNLSGLITAGYYSQPILKEIIDNYKYHFIKELVHPLAELIIKKLKEYPLLEEKRFKENALLIPIPLHPRRLRWRGFNQSELLALEIGKRLGIEVSKNIIRRVKYNLPQVNIKNIQERKNNVKNIFQLNSEFKEKIKNKNIILIDDIAVTGAILEECALILKTAQPKQILGLAIAQG